MFNKKSGLILFAVFFISVNSAFSQSGFDSYLAKDSTYRFNTSLRLIDSLLCSQLNASVKDTSFYNSFGKAEVINLNQLLYFTVNNNPDLKTIQSRIESYQSLSKEKGYLPDPMFEIEGDDIEDNFKKFSMINFYASQTFPFPGKLDLESKSAILNMSMLESEKVAMTVDKMEMVKQNYYDLYLNTKKLQINLDNQQLINVLITATESKYSVGKGMQQEVLKSQIELQRLKNEEFILSQERKNIYSKLTQLTKTIIDDNTRITFRDIDEQYLLDNKNFNFSNTDADKLMDYAFEHRADLKVIKQKIQMSKNDLEMAKLSSMPDFNLKIGYKILPFEEHNGFEFMIGINIPFAPWSSGKYKYAVQRNEINVRTSTDEYETKRNEIRNEIISVINNLKSAKETMNYYNGVLIPQTENTLKSTQYSYENNLTSFLDLLDSYKMYQEARHMFHESVTMFLKMIAELEKLTAMNLKN
jgi:cobalt-zinc-cadmium efflux system outer membrane protein